MTILTMRAYARTKAAIEAAKRPADEPSGPLADLFWENQKRLRDMRKRERGSNP